MKFQLISSQQHLVPAHQQLHDWLLKLILSLKQKHNQELFQGSGAYSELWKVVRILLLLSHGNAAVESGFSVNEDMLVENLQQKSLIAQRIVYDHIRSAGGILNVDISKELISSCKNAYSRYKTYLEEKKKEKSEAEKGQDLRKFVQKELLEKQARKRRLQLELDEAESEIDKIKTKIRKL